MTPFDLEAMLAADLCHPTNRGQLADALADCGRHDESDLCRDFRVGVRVEGGKVVRDETAVTLFGPEGRALQCHIWGPWMHPEGNAQRFGATARLEVAESPGLSGYTRDFASYLAPIARHHAEGKYWSPEYEALYRAAVRRHASALARWLPELHDRNRPLRCYIEMDTGESIELWGLPAGPQPIVYFPEQGPR